MAGQAIRPCMVWALGKTGRFSVSKICCRWGRVGQTTSIGRRRSDTLNGGLVAAQVLPMRKSGEKEMGDERVLGSGDFVENLIREADQKVSRQFADMPGRKQIEQIISDACAKEDITVEELKGGSRRAPVSRLRTQITSELIEKHGITPAEVARQLGITISAVSKIIARSKSI